MLENHKKDGKSITRGKTNEQLPVIHSFLAFSVMKEQ
jgi:hypothetical protein